MQEVASSILASPLFFNFPHEKKILLAKNKPTGGVEPPTFRLQSECSATKLSRLLVFIVWGVSSVVEQSVAAR